jgi:hypothetical protein
MATRDFISQQSKIKNLSLYSLGYKFPGSHLKKKGVMIFNHNSLKHFLISN